MIYDPRKKFQLTGIGFDPIQVDAVSGRDYVLLREWRCWWMAKGVGSTLVLPTGWRFGPGIQSTPGVWRGLVNPMHMIEASAVHDWMYVTQGGARGYTVGSDDVLIQPDPALRGISREFADALGFAICIKDGGGYWSAIRAWAACRLFGKSAWDE